MDSTAICLAREVEKVVVGPKMEMVPLHKEEGPFHRKYRKLNLMSRFWILDGSAPHVFGSNLAIDGFDHLCTQADHVRVIGAKPGDNF